MMIEYQGKKPKIAESAFIAPNATIIGDVTIGEGSSIWYGAVLRGDLAPIVIGARTSIQDNCVVHVNDAGTIVGDDVTVGHGAVLHDCKIGRSSVIGNNAVVLDHAEIGEETVVAAGSVVATNAIIPSRVLVAGMPAVKKKDLVGNALWWVQESSKVYQELTKNYKNQNSQVNN